MDPGSVLTYQDTHVPLGHAGFLCLLYSNQQVLQVKKFPTNFPSQLWWLILCVTVNGLHSW